jgi:hypothetical protein
MTLNQGIVFSDAPNAVRRTFRGGQAEKCILSPGTQLYKFTQHPLLHQGRVSPWWSSVKPICPRDTGLEVLLRRAERLGVSANTFARARNAVNHQWNSMDGLLVVTLKTPVYAFFGPAAHQQYDDLRPDLRNVVFIGGAIQLWLPNLSLSFVHPS